LVSPDWHLVKVANLGWAFERGAGVSQGIPAPDQVQLDTDLNTAVYLAQLGEKLDAMKRTAEARACISRALELAPNDPTVLSHAASFYAERKRWQEVLTYTEKALRIDPDFIHAQLLTALSYYELGDYGRAQDALANVLLQTPDDFYALLLQARVFRAENDFRNEADVLERLVRLAAELRQPQARYLVYLGQAYARQGFAERSAASYHKALDSGELTKQETADVKSALEIVETRSGLK
jgi:tetratricopeptide (TPR) repeat protein